MCVHACVCINCVDIAGSVRLLLILFSHSKNLKCVYYFTVDVRPLILHITPMLKLEFFNSTILHDIVGGCKCHRLLIK